MSVRVTPVSPQQMRRELISAYGASLARISSWLIVSALLYRRDRAAFALLALLRATIGILNYTSLGLAPAVVHLLPRARRASAIDRTSPAVQRLYVNAWLATGACAALGLIVTVLYAANANHWLRINPDLRFGMPGIVLCLGVASVLRLTSDTAGAMLQASNHIATDNMILIVGEVVWVGLSIASPTLKGIAIAFLFSALFVLSIRFLLSVATATETRWATGFIDRQLIWRLFAFGLMVTLAQAADYLYAPTDYLLITRLLSPIDVATYAPAVQIDGGLLVLVGAIASVLLPRSSIAAAERDVKALRRYYVHGSLASLAMLTVASLLVLFIAPSLFRAWLGDSLPGTRAILPLVLLNTTIGGASSVGRSVLLGIGKVRAFTVVVLLAGVVNVVCSYCFVHYLHLGLRGIVLGTVVAVIGRCIIWMPLYVLRTLRTVTTSPPTDWR